MRRPRSARRFSRPTVGSTSSPACRNRGSPRCCRSASARHRWHASVRRSRRFLTEDRRTGRAANGCPPPLAKSAPADPLMSTSYRNIFLLACCQALLLANSAGLAALTGLVGYEFAANKALATLGVTTYVLGSAAASLP